MVKDSQNLKKNKLHFICRQAISRSQLKLKFLHHNLAALLGSYIWLILKINMNMRPVFDNTECVCSCSSLQLSV